MNGRMMRWTSLRVCGAKVVTNSVPAPIMNQWLTSFEETTLPFSRASSSFFWDGSSVFCESSVSSAMAPRRRAAGRQEAAHGRVEAIHEPHHGGGEGQHHHQEAEDDLQGDGDEEKLHPNGRESCRERGCKEV